MLGTTLWAGSGEFGPITMPQNELLCRCLLAETLDPSRQICFCPDNRHKGLSSKLPVEFISLIWSGGWRFVDGSGCTCTSFSGLTKSLNFLRFSQTFVTCEEQSQRFRHFRA
jgi:hypothetical protein